MSKYQFKLNEKDKMLHISAEGFFRNDESTAFINTFWESVSQIEDPNKFLLVIDLTNLAVTKQDLVHKIADGFQDFEKPGFQNIVMINPISILARQQIHNVSRSVRYSGIFVDSFADWNES